MAKLTDDRINEIFKPHLQGGETLKHWAFGIKQPSMVIILPLMALAIIPGVIATAMLTKNYLIGMTEKRFIVLQIKGMGNGEIKEMIEYQLAEFAGNPAKTSTGSLFTHITVEDEAKPFKAKFHRAFSKSNRPHAVAMAEALSAT